MKNILFILALSLTFTMQVYAQTKPHRENNNFIGPVHKVSLERAIIKCHLNVCKEGERRKSTIQIYHTDGALIASNTTLFDRHDPIHRLFNYPFGDEQPVINKPRFDPDGIFTGRDIYIYNDPSLQSEWISCLADGSVEQRNVYLFNYRGRLAEADTYGPDERLLSRTVYAYDDKGNEIEQKTYAEDGSIEEVLLLEYEYDEVGNWIKKRMSVKRPKKGQLVVEPIAVFYRKISYH